VDNKKINLAVSIFVMVGMTVATIVTTALKIGPADHQARILLLTSAFGALMGVAASVTSASGLAVNFVFGLINVLIYGTICLINWYHGSSGLGHAMMHFLFSAPMQVIGFIKWKQRGTNQQGAVNARRLTSKQRWLYTAIFITGSIVAYFIIAQFDRSAAGSFIKVAVVLDVLPLACNILGQLLMSWAYMEQWVFWIGVNVFSIIMWGKTLHDDPDSSYALIYLIKYSFYLLNSANGLRNWVMLSKKDSPALR